MTDYSQTWYHGSPQQLAFIRAGSTVTQGRRLAEIFSHKPAVVSIEDDGTIRHNGTAPGYLYQIAEVVGAADVYPHPRSTMEAGWEWLTTRDLRVMPIAAVEYATGELFTAEELQELQRRAQSRAGEDGQ